MQITDITPGDLVHWAHFHRPYPFRVIDIVRHNEGQGRMVRRPLVVPAHDVAEPLAGIGPWDEATDLDGSTQPRPLPARECEPWGRWWSINSDRVARRAQSGELADQLVVALYAVGVQARASVSVDVRAMVTLRLDQDSAAELLARLRPS